MAKKATAKVARRKKQCVMLDKRVGRPKCGDVVDFLHESVGTYGSASAAAATLIRGTREYQQWLARRNEKRKRKAKE